MARVLMFGRLADAAGWRERVIDASSVAALTALLAAEDPELGEALSAKGVQIALDQTVTRGDAPLTASSEVAYLPPMSGGYPSRTVTKALRASGRMGLWTSSTPAAATRSAMASEVSAVTTTKRRTRSRRGAKRSRPSPSLK